MSRASAGDTSFSRNVACPIWTGVGAGLLCVAGVLFGIVRHWPDKVDEHVRWYVGSGLAALCGLAAVGVGAFARICPTGLPSPFPTPGRTE